MTTQEVRADIARYEARLNDPSGLSPQQISIYREALKRARAALHSMENGSNEGASEKQAPANPAQPKKPTDRGKQDGFNVLKIYAGPQPTKEPVYSNLSFQNESNAYDPTITITWSDGYSLIVNETEAINRFKSTFRDTVALKCVRDARIERMWRWSTPWRASGFYKAITHFFKNDAPTLQQLGIVRPTKAQDAVFSEIVKHTEELQATIK